MLSRRTANSSDRLFAMAVFVRVVETGNFSRAARDLGISQPTASKHVAALEARYRLRLLERTTRHVRATDDGRAFYAQAKKLLSEFDELESVAVKSARTGGGKLRVSCPPALGRMVIAPMVFNYLAANPDTAIDLDLSSRYLDPIEDGVDLAIRIGAQADSSYRARLLAPSLRVLVASPDYLKKHGEPRQPDDLARHRVLVYSYLPNPDVLKLKDGKHRITRVAVAGPLRVNNSEILMSAATTGIGIACLPHWSVREALAAGVLQRLLPDWEPEGTSIYAVYPGGRRLPTRVRRFLDYLAAQMRRDLTFS
jgi:DNA-binding transcriptional LysR family regulator